MTLIAPNASDFAANAGFNGKDEVTRVAKGANGHGLDVRKGALAGHRENELGDKP